MANEITFNATLQVINGAINSKLSKNLRADQTTAGAWTGVQSVPTSDTVIVLSGVTAARAVFIENTDDTNYIDLGPTVAGAIAPLIRLKAGEVAMLPLKPSIVLRGQANTGSVVIKYMLVET